MSEVITKKVINKSYKIYKEIPAIQDHVRIYIFNAFYMNFIKYQRSR